MISWLTSVGDRTFLQQLIKFNRLAERQSEYSRANLNKKTEGNDNAIDTHGVVTAATTQLDIRKASLRSYKKACQSSSISSAPSLPGWTSSSTGYSCKWHQIYQQSLLLPSICLTENRHVHCDMPDCTYYSFSCCRTHEAESFS